MAKKNRKSQEPKKLEIESAEADAEKMESVPAEPWSESHPSDIGVPEDVLDSFPHEQAFPEEDTSIAASLKEETIADDLLDDVRRSLIEEETDKSKKGPKWWRRIGKNSRIVEPETSSAGVEIDLPASFVSTEGIEDQKAEMGSEEYAEQIDDLIEMLETEPSESATFVPQVENTPEPEPEIDFEQLKEQAFRARAPEEGAETASDVRAIALEDGEEVFVEVQSQASDPLEERISAFENALRPYRRYIYMMFAFIGVVMAVIASLLIYNVYKQSRPVPVPVVSNLPYPASVSLPGGWSFKLGRGSLQNGRWEPVGAEWLEGTEVSRWVSLPWSRQLEAVLRTLNPKDPIELVMSNNDKLVYEVYSVYEMTPEEIQKLDANSPSLLLILTKADSEKRWVLTALP